jgi:hypothetical protein
MAIFLSSIERLGLSIHPGKGLTPFHLTVPPHGQITFYRPMDESLREEWRFRGEILEPALLRAVERWGDLSGGPFKVVGIATSDPTPPA